MAASEKPSKEKNQDLELIVKATSGAIWDTEKFKEKTKVGQARDKAVKHFVKEKEMEEGEYDIALLRDSVAQPPLDPEATLAEAGVHDHAHLVLVPKEPQVDG